MRPIFIYGISLKTATENLLKICDTPAGFCCIIIGKAKIKLIPIERINFTSAASLVSCTSCEKIDETDNSIKAKEMIRIATVV
jgi:hypothetical protein